MRLLRAVGLVLLAGALLAGCFYSLDGSLVGKQRDGAYDAFLDAGVAEQGTSPDGAGDVGGADQIVVDQSATE